MSIYIFFDDIFSQIVFGFYFNMNPRTFEIYTSILKKILQGRETIHAWHNIYQNQYYKI